MRGRSVSPVDDLAPVLARCWPDTFFFDLITAACVFVE
jgi:hypothetical protein